VVRFVAALEPAVRFYVEVLGQECTRRTDHWAQFQCGSLRLGLYERSAMATALGVDAGELGTSPGALELAFLVDDVDLAYDAALAAGARGWKPPVDRPWGERTAYLLDPDGGLVELYMPVERTDL